MLIGHQKQWENLKRKKEQQNIPHAMLFCGQAHLGKKTVAIEFLKLFFGENIFSHPDFVLVEPQENEIQISQIRDLNWKLSLKPMTGQIKAAIIDQAHLMNQEAQNCFLKTLEEPKGNALIILISEYPAMMLPTIRSRLQKIKFFPVPEIEIVKYLKTKKLKESEEIMFSKIAMGRPGIVCDFLANPQNLTDFKNKINDLAEVLGADLAKRFQYAKKISEEEDSNEILNVWLGFFRNALLAKLNLEKKWSALKKEYSIDQLKNILKNIQATIFLTSTTNINKKLSFELLLSEM